ncbi:MAG TPA: spore germination protein [Pseudoflavonifractor sp.]|nr:spore germination protein [Pseudoflavonifractor sp.]
MIKKSNGPDVFNAFNERIQALSNRVSDLSKRMIDTQTGKIGIFFIKQLTDRTMLSEYIIKPLTESPAQEKNIPASEIASRILYVDDCAIDRESDKIAAYLLKGCTVILLSWDEDYLAVNIRKIESENSEGPELTYTLRGPKDAFTENLDTNLSLIRYRIKDEKLKIEMLRAGSRTKTQIAVTYIEGVCDEEVAGEIIKRIRALDVDGIVESGKLQSLILNNKYNLFPQMGLIERSDTACSAMLEGKVVVIVEGSGIALMAPKTFFEFFCSDDDRYDNPYLATFLKIVRAIALFISFTLGALYIAVVSFHNDTLPSDYILRLAELRADVPFNPITGVFILEIILEILREALLRIPQKIGPAIGIAGAIIIGQAAIASGIFSPLLLIIVSTSLLSSFAAPDYTIITPFRIFKFLMMLLSGIFGLIGFTMGLCFILTTVISVNSFGTAYAYPFAPFQGKALLKRFFGSSSDKE